MNKWQKDFHENLQNLQENIQNDLADVQSNLAQMQEDLARQRQAENAETEEDDTKELVILDWIQDHCRSPFLDRIVPLFSHLGDIGAIWIVMTFMLLINPAQRRLGIACTISLVLSSIFCNLVLKLLVGRKRPCEYRPNKELLIRRPKDDSFPSGHTSASFAVITVLFFMHFPYWPVFLALGCLIAFSRMYVYVHFPSDILGGAFLGFILGRVSVALLQVLPFLQVFVK